MIGNKEARPRSRNAPRHAKATALEKDIELIKRLYREGSRCIHTSELKQHTRQRLISQNFLIEVIKGWYVIHLDYYRPFCKMDWHTVYYDFIIFYCRANFGTQWHLSQECSLLRHIGELGKPLVLTVHSPLAKSAHRTLLFNCLLKTIKTKFLEEENTAKPINTLRTISLPQSIIRVAPQWIAENEKSYKRALSCITDINDLLVPLLASGRTVIAGRLASALVQLGRLEEANVIKQAIYHSGLRLRSSDPFIQKNSKRVT